MDHASVITPTKPLPLIVVACDMRAEFDNAQRGARNTRAYRDLVFRRDLLEEEGGRAAELADLQDQISDLEIEHDLEVNRATKAWTAAVMAAGSARGFQVVAIVADRIRCDSEQTNTWTTPGGREAGRPTVEQVICDETLDQVMA